MNWADDDDFWNDTPEPASSGQAKSGSFCPQCGSTAIESQPSTGERICTSCGIVLEENVIVSSVQFQEGAGGSSSMVGKFVSSTSSTAYTGGGRGRSFGFSRDSRETTLMNGRKRIQDVASRLRLNQHFVDCAARMYTVAVEKNFVQGRRTTHVVAACLYMACRMENSQHMLIDFSDALQVNVYTLGTCFLKFRRLLGCKLKIVDPALFVYRFAAHLDLGDKANAVGLTALRIVGRMQRDWIVSGRRPAGVCAAALLIAARAHGFSRTKHDVTKVLRVCGMTVNARVKEFEYTPSSSLTLDQFHKFDLETEADPPSFTRNRIKEARALAIKENNVALLTSGALDDPREGNKKTNWRKAQKQTEKAAQLTEMYNSIEAEVREEMQNRATDSTRALALMAANTADSNTNDSNDKQTSTPQKQTPTRRSPRRSRTRSKSKDNNDSEKDDGKNRQIVLRKENGEKFDKTSKNDLNSTAQIKYPLGPNGRDIVLDNDATALELRPSEPVAEKIDLNDWRKDMPDYAAEEIESLFRDDEEVAQKEAIFNTLNTEYIAKMEQKEADRLSAEAAVKNVENEEDLTEQQAKAFKKKRKFSMRTGEDLLNSEDPSTEEVLRATVSSRKISRKINYEAMSTIFDEDGGFSTDLLEDNEGPGLEAGVFQDV